MRLRKPVGGGRSSRGKLGHFVPLLRMEKRCRGENLTGGAGDFERDFGRDRKRRPLAERRTLKEGGSS
jgi:hypothetical protein